MKVSSRKQKKKKISQEKKTQYDATWLQLSLFDPLSD